MRPALALIYALALAAGPLPPPSADLNRDGTVDGLDLAILLGQWGDPESDRVAVYDYWWQAPRWIMVDEVTGVRRIQWSNFDGTEITGPWPSAVIDDEPERVRAVLVMGGWGQ